MNLCNVIGNALKHNKIIWNKHALERMFQRNIYREDVFNTLKNHVIIESYDEDYPCPSFLRYLLIILQKGWLNEVLSIM